MKLCIATTLGRKARGCLAAACAMAALTLILCGATLNAVAQSEDAASPSIDPGSPNAGKSAATTPATPKAATEKTKEKAKPKAKTSETKPESTSVTSTNAAPKKPAKSTASGTATTTRKTGTGGSGDGPSKTASTNGPPAIILRGMRFSAYNDGPVPLTPEDPTATHPAAPAGTPPQRTEPKEQKPSKMPTPAKKVQPAQQPQPPVRNNGPAIAAPVSPSTISVPKSPTAPPEQRD